MPSQDGLVSVQLTFQLRDELLDALFVRRLAAVLLEHPLHEDASRDRLKLAILDARCLFELGAGLWIGGDQLWAGPERREVATDAARLEQLEAIVLLLDDREQAGSRGSMTPHKTPRRRNDARICRVSGRKAGARGAPAAYARPQRG